jgi:hypothetical protein
VSKLGQLCPSGLAVCSLHGSTHCLQISWVVFHLPAFSNILEFPLQLRPHPQLHTLFFSGAVCRDSDSAIHCLASQAFLCNLGGSLHDPTTLGFCMPAKTSIMWTMPRSATSSSSSWASLDHGYSNFWVPGQMCMVKWSWGNSFLGYPLTVPQIHSPLKGKSSNWVYSFIILNMRLVGSG